MVPTSHQLKAAPLSFEKTISQHFDVHIHPELDQNGQPIFNEKGLPTPRLNRRGRRKQEALERRKARRKAAR